MFSLKISSIKELPKDIEWATHVVSLLDKGARPNLNYEGRPHWRFFFNDEEEESKGPTLSQVKKALHAIAPLKIYGQNASFDRLIIHCHAGCSRSTAMSIGALIQAGCPTHEAVDYVMRNREIAYPNRLILRHMEEIFEDPSILSTLDAHPLYVNFTYEG